MGHESHHVGGAEHRARRLVRSCGGSECFFVSRENVVLRSLNPLVWLAIQFQDEVPEGCGTSPPVSACGVQPSTAQAEGVVARGAVAGHRPLVHVPTTPCPHYLPHCVDANRVLGTPPCLTAFSSAVTASQHG